MSTGPAGSSSTEIGEKPGTPRSSVAPGHTEGKITSTLLSDYEIREVSYGDLDDLELKPIVAGVNIVGAEREPRYVPLTIDEFRVFTSGPGRIRSHYIVYAAEGAPAAFLTLSYPDDGSSAAVLRTALSVLPDHRRKGLATHLLGVATARARHLGRNVLSGQYSDTVPAGQAFADAVGAVKTLDFHTNTVRIDDLVLEMLEEWRARGQVLGPGYSVEIIEGMYPEEILDGIAHLFHVLERDSPHPQNWEPREYDADRVKAMTNNYLKEVELLSAIAFEEESGAPVGMSQLGRRRSDDGTWFVTTTMVDPRHRGHGLGKWVKAASCLEALQRWPGAEWMDTGNAFTNDPMLAINHAMGFQHEHTWSDAELTVEAAEAYLASRSG